jgi:hypothetical protein
LKIIAIDLSVSTGVSYFDTEQPRLLVDVFDYTNKRDTPLSTQKKLKLTDDEMLKKPKRKRQTLKYDPSDHPKDFLRFTEDYIDALCKEIRERDWFLDLNFMILEQTNKGRDRWKQKQLEWLHYRLCSLFAFGHEFEIKYIDTMEWRRILGIKMDRNQRKSNKEIRAHNIEAKENPDLKRITGITSAKTLAIDFANEKFGLDMVKKHNNIADSICVGYAWLVKEGHIHE